MEPVNDLKHFSSLVKEAKKLSGKIVSNCYLLPIEIQKYTQNNSMFWESDSSGIYFFYEEEDFYHLYFYLSDPTKIQACQQDKPLLIDLVYRDSQQIDTLQEIENKWISKGFAQYKSFKRMSRDAVPNETGAVKMAFMDNADYQTAFAQRSHYDEIDRLWRNTLDQFSNALPSGRKLLNLLDNKQILCALDMDQHIAAALQFQSKNKVCTIEHVAVDERHRRRGLAKALLQFCFSEGNDIKRHMLWVETSNSPAIKLYLDIGFQFDGMVSKQLFKK